MRLYRALFDACGLAAGLTVAALAVLVSVDVAARNVGWFNLPWLLEVSEYALYGLTFLAAPWVLAENAHVRVDMLVNVLPRPIARGLEAFADLVGLAISGMLIYFGWLATRDAYVQGSLIFKQLIIPEWWLLWIMPFSGLLLALEFCRRLLRMAYG